MTTKRHVAVLVARVPDAYNAAVVAGSVFYFPSTVETHAEADTEVRARDLRVAHSILTRKRQFEIRLCPALLKKPALPTPHFETDQPASMQRPAHKDPFAPPFEPTIFIGELKDDEIEADHIFLVRLRSLPDARHCTAD